MPSVPTAVGPALAPGSATAIIEGAGHFVQLERPDAVLAEIRRFAPAPKGNR